MQDLGEWSRPHQPWLYPTTHTHHLDWPCCLLPRPQGGTLTSIGGGHPPSAVPFAHHLKPTLELTCWPLSPAAYIKAYLLENGVCIAKKKTKVARKSLDPLYNQVLLFPESPQGKVLQVRSMCVHAQGNRGEGGTPGEDLAWRN